MIKFIILFSVIALVNSASVKREEFNSDSLLALANQVNANRDSSNVPSNNSPVYNPNGSPLSNYQSYAGYGNPSQSNQNSNNVALNYAANQQDAANQAQAYADNVASATSNLQASQSNPQQAYPNMNNQGNLYYYYYPVQDKNKEINYQASPSNQYTSSIVQPQNNNEEQANQNNANQLGNQQINNNGLQNSGHDLSYGGAQDLAYTASALNENSNQGQSGSSGYDSQLSNLASALNQYNFGGAGSNGGANGGFNSQFASQLTGLNNLGNLGNMGQGFGEAFSGSIPQASSVPFDPAFSAAMASQLGQGFQPSSSSSGGSSSGPLSQLYQQATQVYQGLLNSATGQSTNQPQFAASQQHPSYEPSTGGSSFRSKYGLGLMMPLIALAGLSLLIPTVTSLSAVTSRKKRSVEDNLELQQAGLGAYLERIDRYYSLYKNAIEREECMNRIICEIGDAVSGVRGKDAFFDFVERVMPNSWAGNKGSNSKVSIFKTSALSSTDKSKCKKYRCQ